MRGYITDPAALAGIALVDDLPEPRPAPDEFLLDVRAYATNPGERLLVSRRPNGWRPGQDVAGFVLMAASDGSGPPRGARVVARLDERGWAERAAVPVHLAAELDARVTFEQAATIPIAGLTALRALRLGGSLLGKQVLVTGATGGVGQFAIQLTRASGARVTAQVSGPARVGLATDLGAHQVESDLDGAVLGPFDVVLDGVGGQVLTSALHHVVPGGLVVLYGGTGGPAALTISDFAVSAHNASIVGFISEEPVLTKGADVAAIASLVADGVVTPVIGRVADWAETPAMLDALGARTFRGKTVLLRSELLGADLPAAG